MIAGKIFMALTLLIVTAALINLIKQIKKQNDKQ